MAKPNRAGNGWQSLLVLGLIWLVGAGSDRLWFALDRSVPAWDQADYLTGALNYWRALQHPLWFDGEWWTRLWMLSSKVPPLTYILTAFFLNLFGTDADRATLVNLFFSAVLLGSVYGLGRILFNRQVALWAAFLCLLFPGLYLVRLDFLLDYPLTAAVTLCFYALTFWRNVSTAQAQKQQKWAGWVRASAFGVCLGLAVLVKQTAVLFLFFPLLWVGAGAMRRRQWQRAAQLLWSLLLSALIFGPWYRANWLLILTASKRATVDAAIAEGDPALNTLDAWSFYWQDLPYMVSWPLLLVPLAGILLYLTRSILNTPGPREEKPLGDRPVISALKWLAIFWAGAYFLCSLNINKDSRYVLPYLPVLSLFLAWGLTLWPRRWGGCVRWGTASLAILLGLLNLWPIGGVAGDRLAQWLSPRVQHRAYLGAEWPHREAIAEITQTAPFVRSTLGVLPSTPDLNQHNFNYYGALANFQVYGRQVGTRRKQVSQDARSLSWFLTKTDDQGSVPKEAQAAIVQAIAQSPDFHPQKTWPLPDGSTLTLYRQQNLPVEVKPLHSPTATIPARLDRVVVPAIAPPGLPVPVTYEWSGSWAQLQPGLVLLTWRSDTSDRKSPNPPIPAANPQNPPPNPPIPAPTLQWLHDHGIGLGTLHPGSQKLSSQSFQVIERMAMLPPASARGTYTLEAMYLNRQTGESYAIAVPPVRLKIDPAAAPIPAAELDWVTQLRTWAAALPKGPDALGPVFEEIGRVNQYDPIQDYTVQAERCLDYRLRQEPENREWAYGLALARALRRDAQGAIAALERVVHLDSQNPYAHAYLAAVRLYNWQPAAAEASLQQAERITSNQPEIEALSAVASLMRGNVFKAWDHFKHLQNISASGSKLS